MWTIVADLTAIFVNSTLCKLKERAGIFGTKWSYVMDKKEINCDIYIEQVIKEKRKENMKCISNIWIC